MCRSSREGERARGRAGFTLIEVVVALALIAVGLTAIGSLIATTIRGTRSLDQHLGPVQALAFRPAVDGPATLASASADDGLPNTAFLPSSQFLTAAPSDFSGGYALPTPTPTLAPTSAASDSGRRDRRLPASTARRRAVVNSHARQASSPPRKRSRPRTTVTQVSAVTSSAEAGAITLR